MTHLTSEELNARLDGALAGPARERAERHLAACATCRDALAELEALDRSLRPALEHDPGEAYFDNFAARVEDRIRAAGLGGAQARLGGGGWLGWLSSPRRLVMVGAVATVIAGAGLVMVIARLERPQMNAEIPALLDRGPAPGMGTTAAPGVGAPIPVDERTARDEEGISRPAHPAETEEVRGREEIGSAGPTGGNVQRDNLASPPSAAREEAPAPARAAPSPQRLIGARRSAGGEDVPVHSDAIPFAAPPGQKTQTSPQQGAVKIVKPALAAPAETRYGAPVPEASEMKAMAEAAPWLCGRVVDPRGRPVMGALVALADLGITASTDTAGRFCIAAPAGAHSLSVMAVGFRESRMPVRAGGEAREPRVTLQPVPVLGRGARALAGSPRDRGKTLAKPGPGEPGAESWRPATDAFAVLAESVRTEVNDARRLGEKAQVSGSAADFEMAAAAWERVVPRLSRVPLHEARFRVAESRFRAWQADPGRARGTEASGALIAYLRYAPTGPQRDLAVRWLAELKR